MKQEYVILNKVFNYNIFTINYCKNEFYISKIKHKMILGTILGKETLDLEFKRI